MSQTGGVSLGGTRPNACSTTTREPKNLAGQKPPLGGKVKGERCRMNKAADDRDLRLILHPSAFILPFPGVTT